MLARTENQERGEQGLPPREDDLPDTAHAGAADKLHLEGSEDAGRALTVDFSDMMEQLKSMPDPDPRAEDYYESGLDFLNALVAEKEDFGAAAPGVGAGAPLAEKVLGLTDEAFQRAHTLLEALSDPPGPEHTTAGIPNPQLYMLMYRLGTISMDDDRRRLLRIRPAPDPSIGSEFF